MDGKQIDVAVVATAVTAPAARTSASRSLVADLALRFGALAVGVALMARFPALRLPVGMLLVAAVAYANGANDVSKSIATLVGSGVSEYRKAVLWATGWTVAGALLSTLTGAALVKTFSTGLLASESAVTLSLATAAIVGTTGWVLLASRVGLPVSTTHALTGSIVCAAAVAIGVSQVKWAVLAQKVALPLLLSPFLGLVLAVLLILLVSRLRDSRALGPVHWLASGAVAGARGLNDAPKLVGLGILLLLMSFQARPDRFQGYGLALLIAVAMGVGSYLGGLRVTETLAKKVTKMDDREGTAANVVAGVLVSGAALLGLPVSTTHVVSGSIIGIGVERRDGRLDLRVVRDMVLAWVVTLPGAGAIAVLAWVLASRLV